MNRGGSSRLQQDETLEAGRNLKFTGILQRELGLHPVICYPILTVSTR